jgi:hypothetical protein
MLQGLVWARNSKVTRILPVRACCQAPLPSSQAPTTPLWCHHTQHLSTHTHTHHTDRPLAPPRQQRAARTMGPHRQASGAIALLLVLLQSAAHAARWVGGTGSAGLLRLRGRRLRPAWRTPTPRMQLCLLLPCSSHADCRRRQQHWCSTTSSSTGAAAGGTST